MAEEQPTRGRRQRKAPPIPPRNTDTPQASQAGSVKVSESGNPPSERPTRRKRGNVQGETPVNSTVHEDTRRAGRESAKGRPPPGSRDATPAPAADKSGGKREQSPSAASVRSEAGAKGEKNEHRGIGSKLKSVFTSNKDRPESSSDDGEHSLSDDGKPPKAGPQPKDAAGKKKGGKDSQRAEGHRSREELPAKGEKLPKHDKHRDEAANPGVDKGQQTEEIPENRGGFSKLADKLKRGNGAEPTREAEKGTGETPGPGHRRAHNQRPLKEEGRRDINPESTTRDGRTARGRNIKHPDAEGSARGAPHRRLSRLSRGDRNQKPRQEPRQQATFDRIPELQLFSEDELSQEVCNDCGKHIPQCNSCGQLRKKHAVLKRLLQRDVGEDEEPDGPPCHECEQPIPFCRTCGQPHVNDRTRT